MARLKELSVGRGPESFFMDPEKIEEKPGYNVRNMESPKTQAYIRQMADSIHACGTISFPEITVRQEGEHIYVVRGHCRRRAFILARSEGADIKGIRCVAHPTKGEAEDALDLLASNDGLDLDPLEKATAIKRLITLEWSVSEIARKRGVTPQTIHNMLALLEAPEEVKDMVSNGEVAGTLAVEVLRKEGADQGAEILKEALGLALESGKKKVTKKHLCEPKKKDETDWKYWGPKFKKEVERLYASFGQGESNPKTYKPTSKLLKDFEESND